MPTNLKPLTAMRFFAAMWVVLMDYVPSLGLSMPAPIGRGYLGVELFFVLSGFILSHVYMQAFGEGRFHYREFLWARLARVYPVHIATLVGLGVLAALAAAVGAQTDSRVLEWSSLPAQLTLTQAWGLGLAGGWNHPSWSISAEWFAYLAFPAFALAFWPLNRRPWIAIVLAITLVIGLNLMFVRIAGFPLSHATIEWGALRIVPCFALGCATWLLWRANPVSSRRLAEAGVLASVAAVSICASVGAPDWLLVIIFGGLIFSLGSLTGAGSKLLTAPLWVYLGEVSFAIYMVCIPWLLVFGHGAKTIFRISGEALPPVLWAILIVGVIPAAMVVHHLVERPAREAMRRHGVPFMRGLRTNRERRTADISLAL